MSIHSTLSSSLKSRKQRSVLKRIERIKYYISKGSFNEQSPVFGLPKIKSIKIKVKKEKTAEKLPVTGGAAVAGKSESPKVAQGTVSAKK